MAQLNVQVPDEMMEKLTALSEKTMASKSRLVRKALQDLLQGPQLPSPGVKDGRLHQSDQHPATQQEPRSRALPPVDRIMDEAKLPLA